MHGIGQLRNGGGGIARDSGILVLTGVVVGLAFAYYYNDIAEILG